MEWDLVGNCAYMYKIVFHKGLNIFSAVLPEICFQFENYEGIAVGDCSFVMFIYH